LSNSSASKGFKTYPLAPSFNVLIAFSGDGKSVNDYLDHFGLLLLQLKK
jgi:hypothetical protein